MNTPRYAVYWAPPVEHPVWHEGSRWLGRDAVSGQSFGAPEALDGERWERLTLTPRSYGFHATLKAPMALADGWGEDALIDAVAACVRGIPSIPLQEMRVESMGDFLALRPRGPESALQRLAEHVVSELDHFRRPLTSEELAKRRAAGLSERQDAYLQRWGYPYVFEDYRFHLTLTGRLPGAELDAWRTDLSRRFASALAEPLIVDAVGVFFQIDRQTPFRLIHRVSFNGRIDNRKPTP